MYYLIGIVLLWNNASKLTKMLDKAAHMIG